MVWCVGLLFSLKPLLSSSASCSSWGGANLLLYSGSSVPAHSLNADGWGQQRGSCLERVDEGPVVLQLPPPNCPLHCYTQPASHHLTSILWPQLPTLWSILQVACRLIKSEHRVSMQKFLIDWFIDVPSSAFSGGAIRAALGRKDRCYPTVLFNPTFVCQLALLSVTRQGSASTTIALLHS